MNDTNNEVSLTVSTCVRNKRAAPNAPSYTLSNARTLRGWTRIRVTVGVDRFPRDCEIAYSETSPGSEDVIVQEGDFAEVKIGDDVVLTGWIDARFQRIAARDHSLAVSARGKCCDLLDCAAVWPGSQFVNQSILSIARQLAGLYGVSVNLGEGADGGEIFPVVVVIQSETVFSLISRLARSRGLLLIEEADGSLTLGAVGTQAMSNGVQEGSNVISAEAVFNNHDRFSDYKALLQSLDVLQDLGDGGNQITHLTDDGIQRLRWRVVIAEPIYGGADLAAKRATWEVNRRYSLSRRVRVVVDSWRDSIGALWQPNKLISIQLPSLKLADERWLIYEVTFTLDESGTRAELTCMPPDGFTPEPLVLNPLPPDITLAK